MGYFPAKSAVSQPTCKVRDTNGRKILAKSVSDGSSPETLHSVVSMMTATLLSFKGHFCPSFTPIEKTSLFGRKNRMVQPDSLNVGTISQHLDFGLQGIVLTCYTLLRHV